MTIRNAPGFSTKTKPQGFTPNGKNKAKHQDAQQAQEGDRPNDQSAPDLNQVTQSEASTIQKSVNLAAKTSEKSLEALEGGREKASERIAAEIARLTDPTLFFAETMSRAADKIRAREDQVNFELDFFAAAAELEMPTPYCFSSSSQHLIGGSQ
jgi:hypothetical protein